SSARRPFPCWESRHEGDPSSHGTTVPESVRPCGGAAVCGKLLSRTTSRRAGCLVLGRIMLPRVVLDRPHVCTGSRTLLRLLVQANRFAIRDQGRVLGGSPWPNP